MSNKHKVKEIDGVEHHGEIPKPQGCWLWFIDQCPLWGSIIILFIIIAIEILGFAGLYCMISSSSIKESFDYSLFSALGSTVSASVQNSSILNRIIPVQSILTSCIISLYMAIVLYKLINVKPTLIKMEDHVVFDPDNGTLRLRIVNSSKFDITNVRIKAHFRIYVPGSGRHATADLQLKRDNINVLRPYVAWNIATKPFHPEDEKDACLDIKRYDRDRVYEFIPDLLQEQYRSDDPEIAKRWDYRNLDVTITIKSPLFGADWVYQKSFLAKDFVCGQLVSVENTISGKIIYDWSSWEQYEDMSKSHCSECCFAKHCNIMKRPQRHTLIS